MERLLRSGRSKRKKAAAMSDTLVSPETGCLGEIHRSASARCVRRSATMKSLSILFMFTTLSAGAWKWRALAPLPQPRAGYGAGLVDHRLVVAGGSYWRNGQKIQSAQTDLFDPDQNRWTAAAPMPVAVGNAASAVIGGTLFILGGTDGRRAL